MQAAGLHCMSITDLPDICLRLRAGQGGNTSAEPNTNILPKEQAESYKGLSHSRRSHSCVLRLISLSYFSSRKHGSETVVRQALNSAE